MIYVVESNTEGCHGYVKHISSNLELAYKHLTDNTDYGDYVSLTVIDPETGEDVLCYYSSYNNPAYDFEKIKKEIDMQ